MKLFRRSHLHHRCDAEVLKVKRGAVLVRRCDGRVQCWCPFLCDATHEQCEFPEINR